MTAIIIDGKAIARETEAEVAAEVARLGEHGIRPGLTVIRVGNDPASELYVRSKAKKAQELGIRGTELPFPETMTQNELLAQVRRLNEDAETDGFFVQLPLPRQLDPKQIIDTIDPDKDVDGFHPISVGRLHLGRITLPPCTPAGVMRMLDAAGIEIDGRHAVVLGRSDIVGKPMAALLLQRNATVTLCHSRSRELASITRTADILIAAVGRPLFVTAEMVKPGAAVIDVGMNRVDESFAARLAHDAHKSRVLAKNGSVLLGDVDFARVRELAGWITPVPGGVGPMTIAMLMRNAVTAAARRRGLEGARA